MLHQLQAVLNLVGMQMGTVMMKTIMMPASSMAGTAVDPILIQIIAQFVNALNEEQMRQNTFFNFFHK